MTTDNSGPLIAVPYSDFMELTKNKLTKREYFAAMALQGMLANPDTKDDADSEDHAKWIDTLKRVSFELADSMIAESKKGGE